MTSTIPKALIPINGTPFLDHQLRLLRARGVERVVLCVGYLGQMVQEFAGDGSRYGLDLTYSFDGERLLGTAGAIRRALGKLHTNFFVLYGDSYLECDYSMIAQTFLESGRRGLMTIYRNEGSFDTSNVHAANGVILRYDKHEKTPEMLHIDYGLGCFDRSVFEAFPASEVQDLAEIYQGLLRAGQLAAYEVAERFYEIGSVSGIEELEKHLGKEAANK